MGYRLDPAASVQSEIRRVGGERLDDALSRLGGLDGADGVEIEQAIHEVRKRGKEVRGLARLVRPTLGPESARFNRLVREGGGELSSLRDAHALLSTFDDLRASDAGTSNHELEIVRTQLEVAARRATSSVREGDPRIERATELLSEARARVDLWVIPDGFDALTGGLVRTYARGRRDLHVASAKPEDDTIHDWRKAVKNLWYQLRLLEAAAPSVISPLIERFDDLAHALGDDHDLSVLVEHVGSDPSRFGGDRVVRVVIGVARGQQSDLRRRAFRLGRSLYAEREAAFVDRVGAYWRTTQGHGPELATGSIAALRDSVQP